MTVSSIDTVTIMSSDTINHQVAILDRAISSAAYGMTPDVARYFLSMALAPNDTFRANELAEKSRRGMLTPEDQVEIDEYRRVGRVLELLKLRARLAIQDSGQ
jgi:hypothetical protein